MVVLKPMLEGEHMKTCACGHVGLTSPVRERTSFFLSSPKTGKYKARCRKCSVRDANAYVRGLDSQKRARFLKRRAEWRAKRRLDPAAREAQRLYNHQRWLKDKQDPALVARKAEAKRKWREKNKERLQEEARIDNYLRREQAGTWSPPPAPKVIKPSRTGKYLPVEPVSNWIEELIATAEQRRLLLGDDPRTAKNMAVRDVANELGCYTRRIYACRKKEYSLDVGSVDAMVMNHGKITIEEIYRNYGDGYYILIASDWTCLRIEIWRPDGRC